MFARSDDDGTAQGHGDRHDRQRLSFADKYMGGGRFRYDGRHGWLLVTPAKMVSWDFAKLDPLRR